MGEEGKSKSYQNQVCANELCQGMLTKNKNWLFLGWEARSQNDESVRTVTMMSARIASTDRKGFTTFHGALRPRLNAHWPDPVSKVTQLNENLSVTEMWDFRRGTLFIRQEKTGSGFVIKKCTACSQRSHSAALTVEGRNLQVGGPTKWSLIQGDNLQLWSSSSVFPVKSYCSWSMKKRSGVESWDLKWGKFCSYFQLRVHKQQAFLHSVQAPHILYNNIFL